MRFYDAVAIYIGHLLAMLPERTKQPGALCLTRWQEHVRVDKGSENGFGFGPARDPHALKVQLQLVGKEWWFWLRTAAALRFDDGCDEECPEEWCVEGVNCFIVVFANAS